jgi:hypothetical protein
MTEEKVEDLLDEQELPGEQARDDIITIVLTADNHLGSTTLGQQLAPTLATWKREEYQQRLRHAFQQATDFAVGQGVDLFVQAGDLFDSTNPSERDRSFVAARLAQLRQAGIRAFAVGGIHDTPAQTHSLLSASTAATRENGAMPAPQISYARLEALHYFAPDAGLELEPVMIKIRNVLVGMCGLGVLAGQEGNPLARISVQSDLERAGITLLILHAPIEGLSQPDNRARVSRSSIENQSTFRYILAGYHHNHRHLRIGECDVIVAGATQYSDFHHLERVDGQEESQEPGFVFLGLATDGIRWCKHIAVDALKLQRLVIHTSELWSNDADTIGPARADAINQADAINRVPTDIILEQLRPWCSQDSMVQLRLEGPLTRKQYHQLDFNQLRRYGEEHCFALAINDSDLDILPTVFLDSPFDAETQRTSESRVGAGEEGILSGGQLTRERLSPREELVALVDEWIATTNDEQEKKALGATKEELLATMDEAVESQFTDLRMNRTLDVEGADAINRIPGGGTGNELSC